MTLRTSFENATRELYTGINNEQRFHYHRNDVYR